MIQRGCFTQLSEQATPFNQTFKLWSGDKARGGKRGRTVSMWPHLNNVNEGPPIWEPLLQTLTQKVVTCASSPSLDLPTVAGEHQRHTHHKADVEQLRL